MAWGKIGHETLSSDTASHTFSVPSGREGDFGMVIQIVDSSYPYWRIAYNGGSIQSSNYNGVIHRNYSSTMGDLGQDSSGNKIQAVQSSHSGNDCFSVVMYCNIDGGWKTFWSQNLWELGSGNHVDYMKSIYHHATKTGKVDKIQCLGHGDMVSGSTMGLMTDGHTLTSTVYPNLLTNTIFETTDTNKHYVWNGTDSWTEIA